MLPSSVRLKGGRSGGREASDNPALIFPTPLQSLPQAATTRISNFPPWNREPLMTMGQILKEVQNV